MLMYGNSTNIIDTGVVFNFTSLKEGFLRLQLLIPPPEIGRFVDRDFDIAYMNYIMSNDIVFKQFFDIMYNIYIGNDVYIIIDDSNWSENIVESLLKLIQQRYGYNGVKINCIDDFIYYSNSKSIPRFDPNFGIKNLDIDRERYTYIVETDRLRNGGKLIYDC